MVASAVLAEECATDNYEKGQDKLEQVLSHVGEKGSFSVSEAESPNSSTPHAWERCMSLV